METFICLQTPQPLQHHLFKDDTFKRFWGKLHKTGVSRKQSSPNFPENENFLLFRTCAYQGVRNVRFSENLTCFVFLKHMFWNSPFCLITDDLTLSWASRLNFFITQVSALKVAYVFKVFGAQICLVIWPNNLFLRGIQ